ncbi:MAG: pyridoxamine 5'-phosphate oxidase family protein [Acidimicrobiales bacterium]
MSEPASSRVTMRRGSDRAVYETEAMRAVLDAALIAHVGVISDDGPIVLPMAFGRTDDELFLHGAAANAMLRAGAAMQICVTVTIVDGLVVARTPFHNSMNYRSVVVRGEAIKVEGDDEKRACLKIINDHVVKMWDTARPPSDIDLKKTLVLRLSLAEMSAKIRDGDPIDEDQDLEGPHWSGIVPLNTTWGEPYAAADLRAGVDAPKAITDMAGKDAK